MVTLTKVQAYITREPGGRRELLVFTHRDYPDAGLQVPAGTVKEGEEIEAALWREVEEETGLRPDDLTLVRKVGVFRFVHPETGNLHVRHVYQLAAGPSLPDTWEWLETGGGEMAEEEGYVFQFYWHDLDGDIPLAGQQGDYLDGIR